MRWLPAILGLICLLWSYHYFKAAQPDYTAQLVTNNQEDVTPPRYIDNEVEEELGFDAMIPPAEPIIDPGAVANPETMEIIAQIIRRVSHELASGTYGPPQELSYHIVFLFQQSLVAYQRFLRLPNSGPDFNLLPHRSFSGRYQFRRDHIFMGQPTLRNGEGRFLTTLFHEYQHHLFHTIYGTPDRSDIVRKFYNELSAHIFEGLFASYLPSRYFIRPHRGGRPQRIRQLLQDRNGEAAIEWIYDWMVPGLDHPPVYSFLRPAWLGHIGKKELIDSINQTFHPDEEAAQQLQDIATDFWETY